MNKNTIIAIAAIILALAAPFFMYPVLLMKLLCFARNRGFPGRFFHPFVFWIRQVLTLHLVHTFPNPSEGWLEKNQTPFTQGFG